MANINKIRLSGTTYSLQDLSAPKTMELTQAQYDALAVKDTNTFYIITDAQGADLSNYYTKSETSGATEISTALNAKVDTTTYNTYTAATATEIGNKLATSDFNTYSGTVDTAINSKASQSDLSTLSGTVTAHTANTDIHVTTAQTAAWDAKSDFSGSYNDLTNKLSAGTGINITDNVISATGGGGGGASYSAGTGIDITNDVISVSGVVMSSAVTSAVTSGSTDVVTSGGVYDQLGGIKIVKLTESEYTALVTKDSNTLYVVIPDPSN